MASRAIHRLTALRVQKAKRVGLHCDGGGLYLKVTESGSKSWVFRYNANGRLRDHGLGPVITVSLAEAREAALRCRKLRMQGVDPIAARQAALASARAAEAHAATFRECATAFMKSHEVKWKNGKSLEQWQQSLTDYVYPVFGDLPLSLIDTPLVMKALTPIWNARPETASRVRGRVQMILDYARVHGFRTGDNPARWHGHLDHLLPARSEVKPVEHYNALPYRDAPVLMVKLREQESVAARALEFLILTAARLGEVRLATWSEIDLSTRTWTVPAGRMKAGKAHKVPLSGRALEVLGAPGSPGDHVFPGRRNGPIGENALLTLLQKLTGTDATVHGLRSTFSDWRGECTNFPKEIAEAALAHAVPDAVEAAYLRTTFFDRRRELMDVWAGYLAGTGTDDKVVSIAGRRVP